MNFSTYPSNHRHYSTRRTASMDSGLLKGFVF